MHSWAAVSHHLGERSERKTLLRIRNLSVGFESQTILQAIDLDVPSRGIVTLLGPGGVGKTTLLRTLGRWNEASPSFWTEGSVELGSQDLLRGLPVEAARRAVPLLSQKARLFTASVLENAIAEVRGDDPLTPAQKRELAHRVLAPPGLWEEYRTVLDEPVLSLPIGRQRMLSVARLTAAGSVCLLADEPLRDLAAEDAARLERLIIELSERQAVVMVTHDQLEARRMGSVACLVTAGRLIETTPTEEFFRQPKTPMGAEFLRSGNCWPKESELAPAPAALLRPRSESRRSPHRPNGFHWVLPERLGGTQWPGLVADRERDLDALAALGVGVLVSLTEKPFEPEPLAARGIRAEHFPIPDMGVPAVEDAASLCARISQWIDTGLVVVLHCKAGLGRTGTLLACVLVERGADAVAAIHRVRCTNPRYIQSEEQLAFVSVFAEHAAARRGRG
jgi:atypical dual specificity phosphatase